MSAKLPNRIIILAGDFNYPDIEWSNLHLNNPYNRAEYLRFLHFTQIHNLTQLVQEPTRGNHILDLILTNHPVNACVHVLEDISDHKLVHCLLSLPCRDKTIKEKRLRNYACANVDKMNSMLADFTFHFQRNFESRSTNQNWCFFRDKLKEIENACIPTLTIKTQSNDPGLRGMLSSA